VTAVPYKERLEKGVMSNFDHAIDEVVARELDEREVWAAYSAWNFQGHVWKDRGTGEWCCEIWQYHHPIDVIRAESLEQIMTRACETYGAD